MCLLTFSLVSGIINTNRSVEQFRLGRLFTPPHCKSSLACNCSFILSRSSNSCSSSGGGGGGSSSSSSSSGGASGGGSSSSSSSNN